MILSPSYTIELDIEVKQLELNCKKLTAKEEAYQTEVAAAVDEFKGSNTTEPTEKTPLVVNYIHCAIRSLQNCAYISDSVVIRAKQEAHEKCVKHGNISKLRTNKEALEDALISSSSIASIANSVAFYFLPEHARSDGSDKQAWSAVYNWFLAK